MFQSGNRTTFKFRYGFTPNRQAGNLPAEAIGSFEKARGMYSVSDDRIRVAVHEYGAIRATKGAGAAGAFLSGQVAANKTSGAVDILTLLELDAEKAEEAKKQKLPKREEP